MADVSLKDLAATADAIVEARVAEPAHEMRQELTDDGCGGFAVEVYRLDVLTVRVAPHGVTVPAHVDAYDPIGWASGMARHEACVKAEVEPIPDAAYATPIAWGPGKELVVFLDWDGTRWRLAAKGSYDDVNLADKAARLAGVKQ